MATNQIQQYKSKPVFKTPQEFVHIKHRITLLQYKYWLLMLRTYRENYEKNGASLGSSDYCFLSMSKLADFLGYEPKTSELENDLEANQGKDRFRKYKS